MARDADKRAPEKYEVCYFMIQDLVMSSELSKSDILARQSLPGAYFPAYALERAHDDSDADHDQSHGERDYDRVTFNPFRQASAELSSNDRA